MASLEYQNPIDNPISHPFPASSRLETWSLRISYPRSDFFAHQHHCCIMARLASQRFRSCRSIQRQLRDCNSNRYLVALRNQRTFYSVVGWLELLHAMPRRSHPQRHRFCAPPGTIYGYWCSKHSQSLFYWEIQSSHVVVAGSVLYPPAFNV